MTFTEQLWSETGHIRKAIEEHPFVVGLGDGTLSEDRFGYYMTQDALYLAEYSRVLATCASQAVAAAEVEFWSRSSVTAITAERELHGRFVGDLDLARRSPTCTAYTSYLRGLGATGSYACLVTGVLPCFWIYQHVGTRLLQLAGDLTGHPYAAWVSLYSDPSFAESVTTARRVVDRAARRVTPPEQARMHEAFATCTRYEWMFWDAAWRMEDWPV